MDTEEEMDKVLQEFYRSYLLSNRNNFNKYTSEWRKSNIKLIYLSCRAKKSRILEHVKNAISS